MFGRKRKIQGVLINQNTYMLRLIEYILLDMESPPKLLRNFLNTNRWPIFILSSFCVCGILTSFRIPPLLFYANKRDFANSSHPPRKIIFEIEACINRSKTLSTYPLERVGGVRYLMNLFETRRVSTLTMYNIRGEESYNTHLIGGTWENASKQFGGQKHKNLAKLWVQIGARLPHWMDVALGKVSMSIRKPNRKPNCPSKNIYIYIVWS